MEMSQLLLLKKVYSKSVDFTPAGGIQQKFDFIFPEVLPSNIVFATQRLKVSAAAPDYFFSLWAGEGEAFEFPSWPFIGYITLDSSHLEHEQTWEVTKTIKQYEGKRPWLEISELSGDTTGTMEGELEVWYSRTPLVSSLSNIYFSPRLRPPSQSFSARGPALATEVPVIGSLQGSKSVVNAELTVLNKGPEEAHAWISWFGGSAKTAYEYGDFIGTEISELPVGEQFTIDITDVLRTEYKVDFRWYHASGVESDFEVKANVWSSPIVPRLHPRY